MDIENKEKPRRSDRVPKRKLQLAGSSDSESRKKVKKGKEVAPASTKPPMVESSISQAPMVESSISQPSTVANVCEKKFLRNRERKLGLLIINCEDVVGEKAIDVEALTTHFQKNIKIDGKLHDPRVQIKREGMNVHINADTFLEQDYVKYLIKTFLKKQHLHNWIKIVKAKKSYVLQYFKM